jgi:deazaflavin-dependent oxidoreductase (nitroreductase family)
MAINRMRIPTLEEAERCLAEAESMNPGPWVQHSRNVAIAARLIAEHHPELDPDTAYILGLLHDIGRREGRTSIRHLIDGYRFLSDLGYEDAARISLTHSFPIPDLRVFVGERDCSPEDIQFLEGFIASVEFSQYDRLIQFCDAIALPSGFCLIEKRMIDVAMRLGINDFTIPGWEARFQIKAEIESAIGQSIYQVLPDIFEGTFGIALSNAVEGGIDKVRKTNKKRDEMNEKQKSKYPPKGLLRILFRIPVYFYRIGLGGLFGKRFVLINHIGRKTGKQHQAVVEVVEREKGTENIIVVAGYGEQTQWYKNLKKQSQTTIQIGNSKYQVAIEFIKPENGEDIIARYLERYGKLTGQLFSMIGYEWDGSERRAREIAREGLRFVRFIL